MQFLNYTEESIYNKIKTLLETPAAGFTNAFNVYGETQFFAESVTPVFPYVYLLGYRVPPKISRMPMIILDLPLIREAQYEIGNRDGNLAFVSLDIFARTRGQRGDLAAFFRKNLFNIPVYDYSTDPATFKYNVQTSGDMDVQRVGVSADVGLEGALNNAVRVSFSLVIRE